LHWSLSKTLIAAGNAIQPHVIVRGLCLYGRKKK